MTIRTWLSDAAAVLAVADIGTARLDALVLLEDVTGKNRAWLLAHDETEIVPKQQTELAKLLRLREQHTPLAYVRGKAEFYGRTFLIRPGVLVPRPESETMIDLLKTVSTDVAKHIPAGEKVRIADVGTGSGALGITAALEVKNSQIELLEIDSEALKIARSNVDFFTLTISVLQSDLLSGSRQNNHILLCNLPYVPDDYHINLAASHEPKLAIFGGPDGLEPYRELFKQVRKLPTQPLYILTEALPAQHEALLSIATDNGYKHQKTDDFIQIFCLQDMG